MSSADDMDQEPVYRSLAIPPMPPATSGPTYRAQLPIQMGAGAAGDQDLPSYQAFSTTSTGYESAVYRSLSVAPAQFELQRAAPSGGAKMAAPSAQYFSKPQGEKYTIVTDAQATEAAQQGESKITPQPHPFYLEPNCYFIVTGGVDELASLVDEVLGDPQTKIDASFDPAKCKWKACSYVRNNCLDFRVVLFHGDWEPDQYVVEFQRRQGCACQFAKLFRKARAFFVGKGKVCNEAKEVEASPGGEAAAPAPFLNRDMGFFAPAVVSSIPKPEYDVEILTPIVNLASSEYADMRCQAVKEIANLAEDDANARKVLVGMQGLVERLAGCAESEDRGLHRCAAAALCSFAQHQSKDCHDALCDKALECLLKVFSRSGWTELETQRQAAQCILRLCAGGQLGEVQRKEVAQKCSPVLQKLRASTTDDRLRDIALSACRAMESC